MSFSPGGLLVSDERTICGAIDNEDVGRDGDAGLALIADNGEPDTAATEYWDTCSHIREQPHLEQTGQDHPVQTRSPGWARQRST
jgi:hypothetical protein